ncbi:bifunctional glutathionylspermidine amidase/synthase [Photobacterium lucens]|uniref:bifunctional glutathionylspermidine amidase/synthase n=1 Tax=Photobacterium lucens TaxID=2562949 RepID=UPI00136F3D22|nr:bifunctional glutathionylspermidine amidase/synthase [Photobacterium lucens]MBP2699971.1 bifunctional glutathionylspermidine amidase/synthase [Vibrio parahaemolyticus]MZG58626.1 bifunctional glutathionylspermidine amidase/synthase [Photobacterium lucens]MZG80673.1 bifunctional glutathionylspermidine amidase/synthase [Photobacterium lucens]
MNTDDHENNAPFGTLLGYAPGGIAIYSSDYSTIDEEEYADDSAMRSYIHGEYMGYKWQCVEFARRFLYINYGLVFTDVGMAYEIFSLRFLRQVVNDKILPFYAFANGARQAPTAGALLIWQKGGEFQETGHVAVITQIEGNKVKIAEQNVTFAPLPLGQQWTRELTLHTSDGCYTIEDTFDDTEILGWMSYDVDPIECLPQPSPAPELLKIQCAYRENKAQFSTSWLDETDQLERTYLQSNPTKLLNDNIYRYFTISESAEQELAKATNELHLMYLHATDKVLQDDSLLELFDIPKILWPRLRLSWQQHRHSMLTGRLDFCMDENGLKVYEYNADSASCHTEACLIIQKWAEQGGDITENSPAEDLLNELASVWKYSQAYDFVHIMQDDDAEEDYHALFMQKALTLAGINSKIIKGLDDVHWNEMGQIIDDDNRLIHCVWKTWAWETAIEQVREVSCAEYAAVPIHTGYPDTKVRLIDVLLRPEIKVFEPLWTVIPSNKAILPVLWSLFPHHHYLLDTDFNVTNELRQSGYAIKPIAGRCGSNIDLVNHNQALLDKTDGNFSDQKNIYQQLWCLPNVENKYLQLCTFTVDGNYGGVCLRSDNSLVIKKDSDIEPLIVLADSAFLKR